MITSLSKTRFFKNNFLRGSLGAGLLGAMIMSTASLYAPLASAASIYKVVDEKTGQVTFTDRPQNYEQQGGKQISSTGIVTNVTTNNTAINSSSSQTDSSTTSVAATQTTTALASTQQSASTATKPSSVNYQLTMLEPSEARAYRRPAQSINVKLQLKPTLQAGDKVIIYLDGNEVAGGLNASIATVGILPGTHNIQAVIKNDAGQTLTEIKRTIYVIQNTTILQNKKKVAEQMLAYERLSWYQKMLLKMHQKEKSSVQKVENNQPMTNDAFTKKAN